MNNTLIGILGEEGSLQNIYPHFVSRPAQIEMAQAVETAIQQHSSLVVEAGTGVGKTFAYLIPALLSDKKILISTGTKNLQDQLFHKDFPIVKKLLASHKKIVLLKGRANYACLYRFDVPQQNQFLDNKETLHDFATIKRWVKTTKTGDVAELENFAEDAAVFSHVTSTAESCLGNECDFYDKCFVIRARKEAMSADVVVINHHLFFADLALKEEETGRLLPEVETVIFDEAHQLYDAASSFLSERFSSRQLLLLLKDIQVEYARLGNDHPGILRLLPVIKQETTNLRLVMGESGLREAWFEIINKKNVKQGAQALNDSLAALEKCLSEQSQRAKGLENAWERVQTMRQFFQDLVIDEEQHSHKRQKIFWFETFLLGFMLYKTPIDFSSQLAVALNDPKKSWIYTSATLDSGIGTKYFTQPLGIQPQQTLLLESPYNYKRQAQLYFPRYLPDVTAENFISCWMDKLLPLLEAANGRAFLLFTSHRAMRQAFDHLVKLEKFTLFMQGQSAKHRLLEKFKTSERAILLGTSSFWQGVDVQGAALCCVCIDKLPFTSPGDPVTKARINAYKTLNKDPFYEYQLPQAVIMLKQGVGRLIRSECDKGVLVIGDLRLLTKPYGAIFIKALPKAPIVRDQEKVIQFLQQLAT